jgi:hypothetical protein
MFARNRVLSAVGLNGDAKPWTGEVEHIGRHWMPAAKMPADAMAAQS